MGVRIIGMRIIGVIREGKNGGIRNEREREKMADRKFRNERCPLQSIHSV